MENMIDTDVYRNYSNNHGEDHTCYYGDRGRHQLGTANCIRHTPQPPIMHAVACTLLRVQCFMASVACTAFHVKCFMCSVSCVVLPEQCFMYSDAYTVFHV